MPDEEVVTWRVDGRDVTVSNPGRVIWPAAGLTKADLAGYYREVAPVMAPYLVDRPLTLRVFPDDVAGTGFYLRDRPAGAPDWLRCVPYRPETRTGERCVPLVDDATGLLWYADRGGVEVHLWPSTARDLDRPDWAIFDLDPGPDVGFERVLEVALLVRDELTRRGISGLPKTSGGRGLHVFVPIEPVDSFPALRDWVKSVSAHLADRHPALIGTAGGRTHRSGLVTVDHAQNALGRNTAAPYTLRATPDATVSTPVTWDEVKAGAIRPAWFTLRTVPERLRAVGDPWSGLVQDARARLRLEPPSRN